MRFRFCGDLDCPDWLLAEINTLSKLSSVKMRSLCQLVAVSLIGEPLDEDKAKKIFADAKLDSEENVMEACVAVLSWILTSSARYSVEPEILGSELEQLGLPKEHTSALCKIYSAQLAAIKSHLATQVLRLSKLEAVSCERGRNQDEKVALLNLTVRDNIKRQTAAHSIRLSADQLALLLSELKTAKKVMESTGCDTEL